MYVLEWYDDAVPIKYPGKFTGEPNLTKTDIREVLVQTSDPASTKEAPERTVKIFYSTHEKYDINKVSYRDTQLNTK